MTTVRSSGSIAPMLVMARTAATLRRLSDLRQLLRADIAANRHSARLLLVVVLFRVAQAVRGDGARPRPAAVPVIALYKLIVEWVLGIELPVRLQVGPGLTLWHAHALVVHPDVRLGARVTLKQGVTIGHRGDELE